MAFRKPLPPLSHIEWETYVTEHGPQGGQWSMGHGLQVELRCEVGGTSVALHVQNLAWV